MYTMDKCRFSVKTAFVILIIFFLQTLVTGDVYDDDDDESGSWNRCPWIRNKLKNGRVKIRSRGRIAKFLCEPGYELAGKRFATCVRGQWNNPIPVCVSRGCHRPPHVDNGRVTMMYRGAVLMYDCLPGYTLEGGASIYCDGRRWSAEPPTCTVSTTDPQMSCDFEDPDLCGWSHDPTHYFDWKRNQFSTPSGHAGTGPSFDHTFGEGKGGFYLYMEASAPRAVNDTARLFSPVYPPEYSGGCFIFWYHMFGSTTGGLRVYVKPESQVFGELPAAWVTFGDQGNQWFRGNISIPHFSERFQIIIEGIRGTSYIGDTAIDDVSVRTVDCDNVGNSTDNDTSVIMADSCRGRCRESDNSSSCGCNDDCVWSSTCCDDFSSICTKGEGDESKDEIPVDRPLFGTTIRLETENVDLITSETSRQDSTDSISVSPTLPPISVSSPISTSSNPKESEIPIDNHVVITTPSLEVQSSNPTTKISGATTFVSSTSTTLSIISSTSSSTSSTTTIPATTTTSTTTTSATTTTPPPPATSPSTTSSTTSTTSTTTTSTTPSTTTTSTTSPTTTTSTTVKSTLPITSSSMSTLSSSSSSSSSKPVTIPIEASSILPRVTTTPTTPVTTTTPEPQTESTQSTRKTYNLRPRFRTTPITTSSPRSISALTTQAYQSTSIQQTSRVFPPTIHTSTKIHVTTARSVFRRPSTPIRIFTEPPSIYIGPRKNFTSSKPIVKPSEISILDSEAHASKASSDNGKPVITIISVIIVIIICLAAGLVFFMRRLKAKKLSKLEDDSEMKFLSENEVVEYSDSSALDRINFNPQ